MGEAAVAAAKVGKKVVVVLPPTCSQSMPNSSPRPRVISATVTSKRTWAGRTSSAWMTCGTLSNRLHTWLTGRPVPTTTDSTCSAATRPSPVVVKSDSTMWPDCSPPTLKPCWRMCSST